MQIVFLSSGDLRPIVLTQTARAELGLERVPFALNTVDIRQQEMCGEAAAKVITGAP